MKKITTTFLSTLAIMGGAIALQAIHPVTAMIPTTTKSETVNHSTNIEQINATTSMSDIEALCTQIAQDDTLTQTNGENLRDQLVAKFVSILPSDNASLQQWIEFDDGHLLPLAGAYKNGWIVYDALFWAIESIQNATQHSASIEQINAITSMSDIEALCTRIAQDETLIQTNGENLRDQLVAKFKEILPTDNASLQPWIELDNGHLLSLAGTYKNGWIVYDALYWAIEGI